MDRVLKVGGGEMTEEQKEALRARIRDAQNRDIQEGQQAKELSKGGDGQGAQEVEAPQSGSIPSLEQRNVLRREAAAKQEQELDDQLQALYRYKETLEKTNKERREKRQGSQGMGEVQSKTQELQEKVTQVMAIEGAPPGPSTPPPSLPSEGEKAVERDPLATPPGSPTPGQAPPSPSAQAGTPTPTFTPKGARSTGMVNPPPSVVGDTSRADQLKAKGRQMKARLHEEPATTVEELQSQVRQLQEDNTMLRQTLSSVLVNLKNSGSLASAVELML